MTDTAAVADSAAVPVEGAPIADVGTNFNAPLGSQIPPDAVAKPAAPVEPKSLDDSIDRAIAKSAAKQAEPKVDAKADTTKDTKPEPVRGEGGKFAPKEPVAAATPVKDAPKVADAPKPSHTAGEPPARFSADAKAEWPTLPEKSRAEFSRMERELTDGYQKYKAGHEANEAIREFHEMAQKSGTTVKDALQRYTAMEAHIRKDLVGGLEAVCANVGVSLKDVAAHVLGQTPDQNASKQDATIRDLNAKIAKLEEQVGGVTQTIQSQQQNATLEQVTKFASEHDRFEELADDIAFFMQSGRAKDLSEAYQLAERLNPAAPGAAKEIPPAASSAAPAPSVQPDKGTKSINGAPSADLTRRAGKRVALSLDESLDRAFGRAV